MAFGLPPKPRRQPSGLLTNAEIRRFWPSRAKIKSGRPMPVRRQDFPSGIRIAVDAACRFEAALRDAPNMLDAALPTRQDVVHVEVEAVQLIEIGSIGQRLKVELRRRKSHQPMEGGEHVAAEDLGQVAAIKR